MEVLDYKSIIDSVLEIAKELVYKIESPLNDMHSQKLSQ